ncbi:MAG TPA: rod-binding protein [Verrucomicrobiae bacterium]|jgi:Rod binding domain-containing protein
MTIAPIQSAGDAANTPVEELAGNKSLTEQQKIAEASRQFEAIMLRQILSESQKPVITSEFTDNSTAAGIYQDYITNTLADSMSKSGTFGLAKIFEQQLSHPASKMNPAGKNAVSTASQKPIAASHSLNFDKKNTGPLAATSP